MRKPVLIDSPETLRRVVDGIRYVERLRNSSDNLPAPHTTIGIQTVIVKVTDPFPSEGYYNGKVVYRNTETADEWLNLAVRDPNNDSGEISQLCKVIGLNDDKLKEIRYRGYLAGILGFGSSEGYPLVVVEGITTSLVDIKICPIKDEDGFVIGIQVLKVYSDGTVSECETDPSDCCQVSYNCISGGCVKVPGTSGTYTTLESCLSGCGGVTTECCPDNPLPNTLYLRKTSGGTTGLCVDNSCYTLNRNTQEGSSSISWDSNNVDNICPFTELDFKLLCTGGVWLLRAICEGFTDFPVYATTTGVTCDPLSITFSLGPVDISSSGGGGCLLNSSAWEVTSVPTSPCISTPRSFNCVDEQCVELSGTDGTYATLADCEADSCVGCCPNDVKPDSICGVWSNLVGDFDTPPTALQATRFATSSWYGTNCLLRCNPLGFGGGSDPWELAYLIGTIQTYVPTATCDPFLVVFDVDFGGGKTGRISFVEGLCCDNAPITAVTLTPTPSSGSAPLSVNFVATPTGGVGPFIYTFDFDDGSAVVVQIGNGLITHIYASDGTYSPSVVIQDFGCGGLAQIDGTVVTVGSPITSPCAAYLITTPFFEMEDNPLNYDPSDGTCWNASGSPYGAELCDQGGGDWQVVFSGGAHYIASSWDGTGCKTFTKDDIDNDYPTLPETMEVCNNGEMECPEGQSCVDGECVPD